MTKVITFGIQKGGCSKTSTSGITALMLANSGYKVLAIDMDSQGNLTQLLTGEDDLNDFADQTILEAMKEQDASKYVLRITDHIDLIPADDYLVTIVDYLHEEYKGDHNLILSKTIESVKNNYDFIILDTPPSLSKQTINSLAASDYVVIMFETSKFCYNAIPRFMETIESVQDKVKSDLKVLGILTTLSDNRRIDSKLLLELAKEDYGDLVFNTIINRRAAVGRLPIYGLIDNPELKRAVDQYEPYLKELLQRVESK